jgi:putative oxidoreductase
MEVSNMNLGLFVLRVVVGGLFIGHGTQKLFGWFNGYGVDGTAGFMDNLGYRPPKQMAVLAGASEAIGGSLLVLGLFTPLAAAAIIGVMVNAMVSVHAPKGVWNQNGGVELPLVYSTIAATLAFTGPGSFAVDAAIGPFDGLLFGFLAAALGVIVGVTVSGLRREEVEEAEAEAEDRRRAA